MKSVDKQSVPGSALILDEAAQFLRAGTELVRQLVVRGEVPGAKIGRRWIFLREDLVAYIRSQYPSPWQAVRVTTGKEVASCHSTAEAKSGGSASRRQVDSEYAALLGLRKN